MNLLICKISGEANKNLKILDIHEVKKAKKVKIKGEHPNLEKWPKVKLNSKYINEVQKAYTLVNFTKNKV